MKKMIVPAILLAIFMSSCSSVPQVQIDNAKAAVESAKTVEADLYMAQEYLQLTDSLDAVLVAIEAEKTKSVGARDFKPFAEQLDSLTALAETIKTNAETKKAQVRIEVQDALVTLNNLVAENKAIIEKTPVTSKTRTAVEVMQNDITMIEASITELNTLINNGDYLTALQKVRESNARALAMNEQLKAQ